MRNKAKTWAKTIGSGIVKTVIYTSVGLMVILAFVGIRGDAQQEALDEINRGTRAMVCVLALPVDGDVGRDQADVRNCLIENGLEP